MTGLPRLFLLTVLTAGPTLPAADVDLSRLPPPATRKGVTYAKDIRPLFEASCFRCHGAERPKGGLRLDNLEDLRRGSEHGPVFTAGQSQASVLVLAVSHLDEEKAMPPKPRPGRGRGGPEASGPPRGPQGPAGPGASGRPGNPGGAGGGGPGGGFGPAPKPLTPEQVGLVRAWIDQGAK